MKPVQKLREINKLHPATVKSGELGDILIAKAMIAIANPTCLHNIVNTQLSQHQEGGASSGMHSAATIGTAFAREAVAVAVALQIKDCIGKLGPIAEQAHEKCEYTRMLDP